MNRTPAARTLPSRRPLSSPRLRLLCIPYAGGGATIYHAWPDFLPADIEVRAVQLPGRQDRLKEPVLRSVPAIIELLLAALNELPTAPLALYGHSLGALIAYELTRALCEAGRPPRALIVAGRRAPHRPAHAPPVHSLSDHEFKEALHRLYGTPRAALQNDDLMEIALPSLRADFTAHDTYRHVAGAPLDVPLTILRGQQDYTVTEEEAAAWREVSSHPAALHAVDAAHLFVDTHRSWVLARVTEALRGLTG